MITFDLHESPEIAIVEQQDTESVAAFKLDSAGISRNNELILIAQQEQQSQLVVPQLEARSAPIEKEPLVDHVLYKIAKSTPDLDSRFKDLSSVTEIFKILDKPEIIDNSISLEDRFEKINNFLKILDHNAYNSIFDLQSVNYFIEIRGEALKGKNGQQIAEEINSFLGYLDNANATNLNNLIISYTKISNDAQNPEGFDINDFKIFLKGLHPDLQKQTFKLRDLCDNSYFKSRYDNPEEVCNEINQIYNTCKQLGLESQFHEAMIFITDDKVGGNGSLEQKLQNFSKFINTYEKNNGVKIEAIYLLPYLAAKQSNLIRLDSLENIAQDLHALKVVFDKHDIAPYEAKALLSHPDIQNRLKNKTDKVEIVAVIEDVLEIYREEIRALSDSDSKDIINEFLRNDIDITRSFFPDIEDPLYRLKLVQNLCTELSNQQILGSKMRTFFKIDSLTTEKEEIVELAKFFAKYEGNVKNFNDLIKAVPILSEEKDFDKQLQAASKFCELINSGSRKFTMSQIVDIANNNQSLLNKEKLPLLVQQLSFFGSEHSINTIINYKSIHERIFGTNQSKPVQKIAELNAILKILPDDFTPTSAFNICELTARHNLFKNEKDPILRALELNKFLDNLHLLGVAYDDDNYFQEDDHKILSMVELLDALNQNPLIPNDIGIIRYAEKLNEIWSKYDQDLEPALKLFCIKFGITPEQYQESLRNLQKVNPKLNELSAKELIFFSVPGEFYEKHQELNPREIISEFIKSEIKKQLEPEEFKEAMQVLQNKYGISYFQAMPEIYINTFRQDKLLQSDPEHVFEGRGKVIFFSPDDKNDLSFLNDAFVMQDIVKDGFTLFAGQNNTEDQIIKTVERVKAQNQDQMRSVILSGHGTQNLLKISDQHNANVELSTKNIFDQSVITIIDSDFFLKLGSHLSQIKSNIILNGCGTGKGEGSLIEVVADAIGENTEVHANSTISTNAYGARVTPNGLPRLVMDEVRVLFGKEK